ncbi:transposase [Spirosoma areae]
MLSHRQQYYPPLLEESFYHIYNRGNNGDNLFYQHRNYQYFLQKYDFYLSAYLETYTFCLLPNHFHLLVRVKNFVDLPKTYQTLQHGTELITSPERIISEQFRRFFVSYAKSIKVQQERTGSIFEKNFRRKLVDSDNYLTTLIAYIHHNPQTHGICSDFTEYPYSSYSKMMKPNPTRLMKHQVLDWFGGSEAYQYFHQNCNESMSISELIIEA